MSPAPNLNLICVVPVYNEETALQKAIILLVNSLKRQLSYTDWQVIIASNGSTDSTDKIGRQLEKLLAPHVRLIVCSQKGRGQALREVFAVAKAKHYLYIDVDLPCRLSDLATLLAPLDAGIDLVTSRRTGQRPLIRRSMTFALRQFNHGLFGIRASDSQCAVKALSPSAAKVLVRDCRQTAWFLDTELIVLCDARGLKQSEVPIHWLEKRFSSRTSKVNIWSDSLKALRALGQIWHQKQQIINAKNHRP